MVEYIDVLNRDGTPAGYSAPRSEIHEKGLWHRVVHIWVVDSNGMVLIQKRSVHKESNPSMWETCAGHIEAGMNSKETAIKELFEELGLLYSQNDLEFLFSYKKKSILNNGKYFDYEMPDVYLITLSHPLNLNTLNLQIEEVSDAKLVTPLELYQMITEENSTFATLDGEEGPLRDLPYFNLFKTLAKKFPTPENDNLLNRIN
ncbi:hypothetical protein ACTA71_010665 [Dictyostelium dimigraforme]